jgi:hypothetical protein
LTVAQGGTGATTLTANNVVLGNGTSAVQFVAPGTSGNVLVSNGSTWTSGGAGVTSAVAGNGIAVSSATGAVTISAAAPSSGSIGSYCFAGSPDAGNSTIAFTPGTTVAGSTLRIADPYTVVTTSGYNPSFGGTWQSMGRTSRTFNPCNGDSPSSMGLWVRIS